jgi:hypothetical protein
VKDVEWMVDNWKKLKAIGGWYNDNLEVETHIQGTLEAHNIDPWCTNLASLDAPPNNVNLK